MTKLSRFALLLILFAIALWHLRSIDKTNSFVATNAALPAPAPAPEEEQSFRILLGMTDQTSATWDGSLTVSSGIVVRVEPWRFDQGDRLEPLAGNSSTARWKISTHPARAFGGQNRQQQPVVANGLIATLRNLNTSSEVTVESAQGKFQFKPAEIGYGKQVKLMEGRVRVDRVPASNAVVNTKDEQDFPAASADRDGNVWVAFQQFTLNQKFIGFRNQLRGEMKDFNELRESPGGDQVMLAQYSRGKWADPIAISEPGGDLFKTAVAIDGSKRAWVFWSENKGGNFDIYARAVENDRAGKTVRLSSDNGPDIAPVAAADSQGRVWVAWQAFGNGRSQIRAAHQNATGFSDEIVVASSASNEWNPAIAASSSGEVTIAWDSYRNGDYSVYFRTFDRNVKPGEERAAAATARYEAYPSIAYDSSSRLWLAWEESDTAWGKDFGADETTGIGLYHGRWVRVRVFQGDKAFDPPDVGAVLPGAIRRKVDDASRQSDPPAGTQPNPQLSPNRRPNQTPQPPPRSRNSFPRLLADGGGRIWLAYRTAHPTWWIPLGTVWFENVVTFDGQSWSNPIFINHSANLLDKQPALVSTSAGELMIVNSSDGRQEFIPQPQLNTMSTQGKDPYNNDLFASRIVINEPVKPVRLNPVPVEAASTGAPESPDSRRLREYRTRINNAEYRILRGEFHRHTEISGDGGNDGSIWDAFRYAIDAASLDWIGCCDHDNGAGREYTWWLTQKLTDVLHVPGAFTPMFSYERSVAYPEGHRNIIFAERGIRTLPRLPKVDENAPGNAPDTQLLYKYLRHFNGIAASHTSGTNMGTDWRDNDPLAEPVVEIYQGDRQNYEMPDAPRSNNANDSIGGWRPKGFINLALEKGYKLGFQASSDHISTHMSYCNVYVTAPTRGAILEAFQKRHVYGATDDILADVRSGERMMGDQFETAQLPALNVKLIGTAPFAKVHIIKDNKYVYTTEPKSATVSFTWRDEKAEAGKMSYYYLRGEQQDGEIVWVSPMWITYRGR
jgi:hypothetical protein